ncbi:hypothetical protein L3073_02100 [Ancylomarina sp. DW003]|nr:hypothetical protein [Ancylomarina sp. DW003]MDE5420994.1 hypothetical protein [Ancylomarina sp. DW003]
MSNNKYDFDFPEAKGEYWFLLWIGKIHYTKRQKKVQLFFINKSGCNNYVSFFN